MKQPRLFQGLWAVGLLLALTLLALTGSAWAQSALKPAKPAQLPGGQPGNKPIRTAFKTPAAALAKDTSAVGLPASTTTGSSWYEMNTGAIKNGLIAYTTYCVSANGIVVVNPRLGADPLRPAEEAKLHPSEVGRYRIEGDEAIVRWHDGHQTTLPVQRSPTGKLEQWGSYLSKPLPRLLPQVRFERVLKATRNNVSVNLFTQPKACDWQYHFHKNGTFDWYGGELNGRDSLRVRATRRQGTYQLGGHTLRLSFGNGEKQTLVVGGIAHRFSDLESLVMNGIIYWRDDANFDELATEAFRKAVGCQLRRSVEADGTGWACYYNVSGQVVWLDLLQKDSTGRLLPPAPNLLRYQTQSSDVKRLNEVIWPNDEGREVFNWDDNDHLREIEIYRGKDVIYRYDVKTDTVGRIVKMIASDIDLTDAYQNVYTATFAYDTQGRCVRLALANTDGIYSVETFSNFDPKSKPLYTSWLNSMPVDISRNFTEYGTVVPLMGLANYQNSSTQYAYDKTGQWVGLKPYAEVKYAYQTDPVTGRVLAVQTLDGVSKPVTLNYQNCP
jgi:hypothetical protein